MNRPLTVAGLEHGRHLRLWVLFALLVLLMQFSDPLGEVPMRDAVLFWSARLIATAVSLIFAEWALSHCLSERLTRPYWVKPTVLAMLLAAIPMTLAEFVLESVVPQSAAFDDSELRAASPVLALISEYLTILSVILPVNVFLWVVIDGRIPIRPSPAAAVTRATLEPSSTPIAPSRSAALSAFLARTHGITLEDIIALSAEEHYVRVWTEARSELVYGRFRDAVSALPQSCGLQVHRSWWVADRAVVSARRGARRYALRLSNGLSVPVSDRFVARVRERGLLNRRLSVDSRTAPSSLT